MKNSKRIDYVPGVHTGCSLAETGLFEFDDFDNPLKLFDPIPEDQKNQMQKRRKILKGIDGPYEDIEIILPHEWNRPSSVRTENVIRISVPADMHSMTFLKGKGIDISNAWIFIHEDVVKTLRRIPLRYHQKTVAYGEFFRFNDYSTISLQSVEYFPEWKILLDWQMNEKEEKSLRKDIPEFIIEIVMD